MRKFNLLFLGTAIALLAFEWLAEAFKLDYAEQKFEITVPLIPNQKIENKTPYTKLFLETGDGSFRIFTHPAKGGIIKSSWYYENSQLYSPGVHKLTFYDTIKLPPRAIAFRFNDAPAASEQDNEPVESLGEGERIKLTPLSTTLLPGDLAPVAISYKPMRTGEDEFPVYSKAIIAFFYNSSDNPALFDEVNPEELVFENVPGFKQARKHHGENLRSLEQFDENIQEALTRLGNEGGFKNSLFYETPINSSNIDIQQNIFFSMNSSTNLDLYKSSTSANLMAALVLASDGSSPLVFSYPLGLNLRIQSRDPNELTVSPGCLGFKPEEKLNRDITYQLHFENEGGGIARNITCTLSLPRGIAFPTQALDTASTNCSIGGRKFKLQMEWPNLIVSKTMPLATYQYIPQKRQIIFRMRNVNLSGTIEAGQHHDKTEGAIRIKLKTVASINEFKDCMYSRLSIQFDDNAPVVCEPNLLKGNCSDALKCSPMGVNDGGIKTN